MAESDLVSVLRSLNLSETSAIQIDKVSEDYVLDLAAQSSIDQSVLAATSSNYSIRLFTRQNLATTNTVKGHEDVITSIRFGKTDPNLLFSGSLDGTIRCWDLRTDAKKAAQIFKEESHCISLNFHKIIHVLTGYNSLEHYHFQVAAKDYGYFAISGTAKTNNQFSGIDVNAADRVICAGMERDKDHNVYLLFWDRRGGKLLGCYSESHDDDITQVCFHPENSDRLATGSTDGLVCVYDISETSEEDALSLVLNSCSTVAKIGWTGSDNSNIFCTTHIDTFHVWETGEGDPVIEKTDMKENLSDTDSIDYLVDHFCTDTDDIYLLGGKHNGDLKVIQLRGDEGPEIVGSLIKGHNSTVRCLHWDKKSNSLITGGEDSLLCLWSTEDREISLPPKLKLKAGKSVSKRKGPY